MFKISVFGLSSVFYTSCTKKEPYPFIGKTHKFKNLLNLMTLGVSARLLMKEFGDDLRSKLWGGHLWNPSYFVATVSENTEEQIIEYIRSQKRK